MVVSLVVGTVFVTQVIGVQRVIVVVVRVLIIAQRKHIRGRLLIEALA